MGVQAGGLRWRGESDAQGIEQGIFDGEQKLAWS